MAVRALAASLPALWCFTIVSIAAAGEPELALRLTSGRQFKGAIDPTSTAEQLVLRTVSGGITLRRPILWQRVEQATLDGKPADVATLRDAAASSRRQAAGVTRQASEVTDKGSLLRKIVMRGDAAPAATDGEPEAIAEQVQPRVAMITFDAAIVNWDADVETDGVVVTVAPLDINRYLIPSNGTLEVELFAPQRRIQLDLAPMSGGDTMELVERWTRAITPEDFGPSGVRLRLPFGAITPELQPNWTASWYGLVHVRLTIPGQGVFDDSRDGVRIRPWAPNRDRMEMKTGQRFLSTENLGRRE